MFERNKIDNAPETTAVPVEITYTDGAVAKGKLLIPTGRMVVDALNGVGGFIEFEPYGGERTYLAKAQLGAVKLVGVPRLPNLQARARDLDGFDPYVVLGIGAGASGEEIHAAYVRLAKTYHPDRYSTAELPEEVREYLSTMARRINAANQALETPRHVKAARQEPIFTSKPRA
jgi:hypothetical protein